jgi:hypothetical protein
MSRVVVFNKKIIWGVQKGRFSDFWGKLWKQVVIEDG